MTVFDFTQYPVLDESGNPAIDALGQVYAETDTSFTTPLATTDLEGLPVDLRTNVRGMLPAFRVDTEKPSVRWKSGGLPVQSLISITAAANAAGDAADAKATALAAAGSAAIAEAAASDASAAAVALAPDGGVKAVGKGELVVNVRDFGAVGDGVTDDTAAVQDFFDYLAANGGKGTGRGTFRVTASVNIHAATEAFVFEGDGSATVFALDGAGAISAFSVQESSGLRFKDFTIDGGRDSNVDQTHGASVQNCQNTTFENVRVRNFGSSGILFMKNGSLTGESFNNHLIRCEADGLGVGRNGFLHVTAQSSSLTGCIVRNLDRAATPSYALQLKNGSIDCRIDGGFVDGAVAGVAFGYEGTPALTVGTVVRGVSVVNCDYGLIMGYAHKSDIDMAIDLANDAGAINGIYVGSNCEYNTIAASIRGVPATADALFVGHSLNSVTLRRLVFGEYGTNAVRLGAGVSYTSITVEQIAGQSTTTTLPVLDESGGSNNFFTYEGDRNELESLSASGTSRLRFPNASIRTPRVDLEHASATFVFRPGGSGGAVQVSQTQVAPYFGAAGYGLGKSDRGWSNLFMRSPNGTIYQVTMSDAGAIQIAPA